MSITIISKNSGRKNGKSHWLRWLHNLKISSQSELWAQFSLKMFQMVPLFSHLFLGLACENNEVSIININADGLTKMSDILVEVGWLLYCLINQFGVAQWSNLNPCLDFKLYFHISNDHFTGQFHDKFSFFRVNVRVNDVWYCKTHYCQNLNGRFKISNKKGFRTNFELQVLQYDHSNRSNICIALFDLVN